MSSCNSAQFTSKRWYSIPMSDAPLPRPISSDPACDDRITNNSSRQVGHERRLVVAPAEPAPSQVLIHWSPKTCWQGNLSGCSACASPSSKLSNSRRQMPQLRSPSSSSRDSISTFFASSLIHFSIVRSGKSSNLQTGQRVGG